MDIRVLNHYIRAISEIRVQRKFPRNLWLIYGHSCPQKENTSNLCTIIVQKNTIIALLRCKINNISSFYQENPSLYLYFLYILWHLVPFPGASELVKSILVHPSSFPSSSKHPFTTSFVFAFLV